MAGIVMISLYRNHPEVHQTLKNGRWSHDLFGCFDNMGLCMIAFCVPCVLWGQTAEQLGKDCCLYGGCLYCIPFLNCHLIGVQRAEIRHLRGIDGTYLNDCCVGSFCTPCTLVQEQQEVEEIKHELIAQTASRQGQVVVTRSTTGSPPQNAYVVQGPASFVNQTVDRT